MLVLLKRFLDLCLFQANPQDLPTSGSLVAVTGVLAIATAALTTPLLAAAIQVPLVGGLVWSALSMRGYSERWRQTLAALFGAAVIIDLIAFPVIRWWEQVKDSPEAAAWPSLLIIALLIWSLAVMAHILRNALEIGLAAALAVSIAIQFLVGMLLLPAVVGA